MKKGYWIVAYRAISNPAALQDYAKIAGAAIQANGGKTLVRTSDGIHPVESGLHQRTVIIEFESFEKAVSTYQCADYKKALEALGTGAERDFRIVEGV